MNENIAPVDIASKLNRNLEIKIGVIFLALFIILFSIYYAQRLNKKGTTAVIPLTNNTHTDSYLSLKKDTAFVAGQDKQRQGNYAEAIELYAKVPTQTKNEYSLLQYQIASVKLQINTEQGVRALAEISASSSISDIAKAYAINNIGRQLMSRHDVNLLTYAIKEVDSNPNISNDIKKLLLSEEYYDNWAGIFELSSFYAPISDTEMRLAYIYAIKAKAYNSQGDKANFEKYEMLAINKINSSDKDIDSSRTKENLKWMYPLILSRKAMTLEILKNEGVKVPEPSDFFKQALNISLSQGINEQPFIQYHYATYLYNTYGGKETEQIINLIKPIVEKKDTPTTAVFIEFAKNAFINKEVKNTKDLNAISKIYPPFAEIIK